MVVIPVIPVKTPIATFIGSEIVCTAYYSMATTTMTRYVRKTVNVCVYRRGYERLRDLGRAGDPMGKTITRLLDEREDYLKNGGKKS